MAFDPLVSYRLRLLHGIGLFGALCAGEIGRSHVEAIDDFLASMSSRLALTVNERL